MKTVYFNFNNEVDVIELNMNEETGAITVPGQEGLEFDSIDAFAGQYAQARDVHPNNLKNWSLTANGDTYVFALRAATGGISSEDINFTIDKVLGDLSDDYHVLEIRAMREYLHGQADVIGALTNYEDRELSMAVYDALEAEDAFDVEEEEIDERSDIEILLDEALETVGSLVLYAKALNLPVDSDKSVIIEEADLLDLTSYELDYRMSGVATTLQASTGVYNFTILSAFVTQKPEGVVDEDVGDQLDAITTFAGRDTINIKVIRVGKQFVKETNKRVSMSNLEGKDIRLVEGAPAIFEFSDDVDTEVKDEMRARREEERNIIVVHNDEYIDEDDYDYDEDEYFDEDEFFDDEDEFQF